MKKKQGAASFYIVAFSTLILTVIAISFATIIMSEVSRTIDADLSQSAYDSALVGIEDAKLAILNYRSCVNQGHVIGTGEPTGSGKPTCSEIIWYMENPDCNMVGHILGRIPKDVRSTNPNSATAEVPVQENTTGSNNMEQAYTCVKIEMDLSDYRGTLTSEHRTRIIPISTSIPSDTNNIKSVRISWHSDTDESDLNYNNFIAGHGLVFPRLLDSQTATPPTIKIQLIQTAQYFNMSDFDKTVGDKTNRGSLTLVPVSTPMLSEGKIVETDHRYYDSGNNVITNQSTVNFLTSNDKNVVNLPVAVHCDGNAGLEYVCSASIELPRPIDTLERNMATERNPNTFMFVVSLPYGRPDTDFALEICKTDQVCNPAGIGAPASGTGVRMSSQISIDSTGRANDLYRRVVTRVEGMDVYSPVADYELQLTGTENDTLVKDLTSIVEQ